MHASAEIEATVKGFHVFRKKVAQNSGYAFSILLDKFRSDALHS